MCYVFYNIITPLSREMLYALLDYKKKEKAIAKTFFAMGYIFITLPVTNICNRHG